jgi:hypothetical protein
MGKDAACRPQQFLESIRLRNPSPLHRGSILIVNKKGYISVGRQHVAEGYIAIVLKGAHVPFMLRKRKEQYLLVGDACKSCLLPWLFSLVFYQPLVLDVDGGSRERGIFSSRIRININRSVLIHAK